MFKSMRIELNIFSGEDDECGKLRDAGYPKYKKHNIKFLTGHCLTSCKKDCRSNTDCKIIIFGKHGIGYNCGLYRESARTGCSIDPNEIDKYAMYSIGECANKGLY